MFGLLVALAIEFPAVLFKIARKFVVFQQGHLSSQTPSLGNPRRARVEIIGMEGNSIKPELSAIDAQKQ